MYKKRTTEGDKEEKRGSRYFFPTLVWMMAFTDNVQLLLYECVCVCVEALSMITSILV